MPFDTAERGVAPYPTPRGARPRDRSGVDLSATVQVQGQASYGSGFGSRMVNAFRYLISGVDNPLAFFGPQQPLLPTAQEPGQGGVGRQFDYPSGFNTRTIPRGEEPISFATMKAMADGYDLLRLLIETRKDQVARQQWSIGPKDDAKDRDPRCDMLEEFWNAPDRSHTWAEWIRMVLEQLLVLDAPALYCEPDRAGNLYSLNVLDGALITRKLTLDGRTPTPDEGPAFQEIIKGLPAVDYIIPPPYGVSVMNPATGMPMPELIYKPRNLRADRVYGYSPVEQIITTVNIALNRQLSQLSYYTAGSTPDLIMGVPETWNPDQIAQFKSWWDSVLLGNVEGMRGTQFIPGGIKPFDTKERMLMDQFDEWLARICCFAFSISPTAFVKQNNRATADSEKERSSEEGFLPVLRWVSDLVEYVHRVKFGIFDLELRWEQSQEVAPLDQAQIHKIYLDSKVYHPDEIRQKLGDDPMEDGLRAQMDLATVNAAPNATQLPPDQQAAADDRAKLAAEHAASLIPKEPTPQQRTAAAASEKADFAAMLKALVPAPSSITVAAPQITLPPITMPAIKVDAPVVNIAPAPAPSVQLGDTFIDVGSTNVRVDQPKPAAGIGKTVTAERTPDGGFVGTITDGVRRTVRLDASGAIVKGD